MRMLLALVVVAPALFAATPHAAAQQPGPSALPDAALAGPLRALVAAAQQPAARPRSPALPAPDCTTASIMAAARRPAAQVSRTDPGSWPIVEVTVGPDGNSRCRRIAQVFSALQDSQPLKLTVTLDPSVEYVDDTSSHFHAEAPGAALDWPPFEQVIRGWTLIRSRDPARLAILRSGPRSLYYGKGILVLDPGYDGADQTLENIRLIGARRGDVDGRLNSVWMEPSDRRATITFRRVVMEDADTCLLNGGPNHTVVLDTVWVNGCGSGSGMTHNIYVGRVARFEARNVLSTDVWEGHLMKVRAAVSVLENVRLLDGKQRMRDDYQGRIRPAPQSSYALDFPNGGDVTIRGLMTQKGAGAANTFHIAFGEEAEANGGQWPTKALRLRDWTATTVVNADNQFARADTAAGLWDATGGLVSANGVTVSGVAPGRMLVRGKYGATTVGPLPTGGR